MKIKIKGEQPWQVIGAHSFGVSPSSESYILQYSCDGINYTDWGESVPANENLFVINVPKYSYYKLKNNNSDVIIIY